MDLTTARIIVLVGAVVGLISLLIAARAILHVTLKVRVRASSAVAAIVLGVLAVAVSLTLAKVTDGFGTRGADIEAMGALLLGMIGGSLGEIALMRLRGDGTV